ncbi:MAG: dUTP diphosphatase [Desulfobulbaceae bacterium]|nr:MAG: dUTP diphosphatase [Desulfobulbaceae bacterium]
MTEMDVPVCWLYPEETTDLQMPCYQSSAAAGMDVQAAVKTEICLGPGEISLVPTGFAVAIPSGFELQVRPRSGLACKYGITIVNSPGTIDSDYRGEVKIALINLGRNPYTVRRGDRIAQLILAPVLRACMRPVSALDATVRAAGGFGHTGV